MTTPEEALAELGLTVPEVAPPVAVYVPAVRTGRYVYTSGQLPMRNGELIATGHTAIICGSDLMALGAIRAARARGLDVPADISVVGYDDSPLIAFTDPPLTTVRQPVQAMGHAAVSALVAEINGVRGTRTELLFHPELIVRGSTGVAPAVR